MEPIESSVVQTEELSIAECMNLRWGRASFGGFNKQLERLAEKMNGRSEEEEEDMGEDIDAAEVSRRLALIRAGQYVPDEGNDEVVESPPAAKKIKIEQGPDPECETLRFKRPT